MITIKRIYLNPHFRKQSPAGLLLTVLVFVMYKLALLFEEYVTSPPNQF